MAEHERLIKILSNGTRGGSDIIDAESGETLRNVMSVDIHIDGIEPTRATIEVLSPAMDITATAKEVQVGWIADLYRQRDEAQAQVDRDRLDMQAMIDHAQQQAKWEAQARSLLERVADFDSYDDFSIRPLQEEISAFLAEHPD